MQRLMVTTELLAADLQAQVPASLQIQITATASVLIVQLAVAAQPAQGITFPLAAPITVIAQAFKPIADHLKSCLLLNQEMIQEHAASEPAPIVPPA